MIDASESEVLFHRTLNLASQCFVRGKLFRENDAPLLADNDDPGEFDNVVVRENIGIPADEHIERKRKRRGCGLDPPGHVNCVDGEDLEVFEIGLKVDERRKLRLTFPSLRLPEVQNDDVLADKRTEGDGLAGDRRELEIGGAVVGFQPLLCLGHGCTEQTENQDGGDPPTRG